MELVVLLQYFHFKCMDDEIASILAHTFVLYEGKTLPEI